MLKIEIHGYSDLAARQFRESISRMFKDKSYAQETIITTLPSVAKDLEGRPKPFVRLVSSCQEHTGEILRLLSSCGVDIEHFELKNFYEQGRLE